MLVINRIYLRICPQSPLQQNFRKDEIIANKKIKKKPTGKVENIFMHANEDIELHVVGRILDGIQVFAPL